MKKRLLAMLMAAVFAVSLTACGSSGGSSDTEGNAAETEDASAGETADSGDKKVLRVAMECSYAPYNWTQPDDSNGAVPISGSSDYAYGYDVMMAQHIADELGYELEIQDMEFDSILATIASGKADFGAAGMTVDEERLKNADFTDTYANATQVVIVRK